MRDVYITGSTVVRHKVVNGRECDVFPVDYDTQLVLTAKHLYKLRQSLPPAPTVEKQQEQQQQGVQEENQPTKMEETNRRAAAVVQTPSAKLVWRESLGLVRAVIPLHNHPFHEWAAVQNIPCNNCYGFAIEYFNPRTTGPKPASKQTAI
ncbi:hypothetical protein LSM04_003359 [Trypanosoma melophagium]|uniref:uncharacterized protein n=1 Tax=Trypanosoma melophagium TaxID=715481 RepID=UPI00351A40C6|nr:hypothetical protein LSM04_003359 [Trypanosoma melophagium]